MKKNISIALFLILITTVCCSCGKKEPQTGVISSIDCFDNAGFSAAIKCKQSGACEFTANESSVSNNITWEAYVFSKPFDDAPRYIPQASFKDHTTISSTGSIKVKGGDYLYIYCSENSFTVDSAEVIPKDASLSYSIQ